MTPDQEANGESLDDDPEDGEGWDVSPQEMHEQLMAFIKAKGLNRPGALLHLTEDDLKD
jgi:hypothetical protein